jgi:hypothetical protein
MNLVTANLSALESRNYVIKARKSRSYSFNFHLIQMQERRDKFGSDFYLIIYDPLDERDFFVVPYEKVASAFTEKSLVNDVRNGIAKKTRWTGRITGQANDRNCLHVTNSGDVHFDLNCYHGNQQLLERAVGHIEGDPSNISHEDALEEQVRNDNNLDDTEKQTIIFSRRGQGLFRLRVLALERSCRVTGVAHPDLLEASHIKSWGSCISHQERLDGHNGLLLTPTVHRLFDIGCISFERHGEVLISTKIDEVQLGMLHLPGIPDVPGKPPLNVGLFTAGQRRYLAYHRENIFRP